MWLFTLHGFFSVVNLRHGFDGLPPAAPTFMVRARRRAHLVALQAAHPERLGGLDILGLGLVDPVPALPEARIPCPELVLSR